MIYLMEPGVWFRVSQYLFAEDGIFTSTEIDEWIQSEYGLVTNRSSWVYDVTDETKLAMFILRWE